MKIILLASIFSLTATAPLLAAGTNVLSDEKARISYAVGMMLGSTWKQQGVDVDNDMVLRGLTEQESGGPTLLTVEEMQTTLREFQQSLVGKQQKMRAELAVKNKAEGEAFLATNKNQPGVITLPDGLQYQVITAGDGAIPTAADSVSVNYRGTFLNGKEFDSSYKRGQPAHFPLGGVIRGWTEALAKMKTGSKWRLFIPSELAYGEQGNRGIPPNSTLIFEVELLSIEAPKIQPAAAVSNQSLTSDIIRVPSAEEMKKGAKIEVIKPEDAQKMQSQSKTN